MKNILLIIFIFNSIFFTQSKEKYLVFLKDKGADEKTSLSKNSNEYQNAMHQLTPKSIERRRKTLGDEIIDFNDIPINDNYINTIESTGAQVIWKLKWFNAVSCSLTNSQRNEIEKLSFVDRVEKVKSIRYNRDKFDDKNLEKTVAQGDIHYNLDYGFSLTQNNLSDIPVVHDLGYAGQDILVGLLDAGFAWRDHPSLSNANVLAEYDFVYGDSLTDGGDASHGTAVFSIIGGFHEGWLIGPAYAANYVLAKTEEIRSETNVEEDNFAAALEWMERLGVDIASSSLGYSEFDDGEESYSYSDMDGKTTIVTKAMEIAFSKGMVTINSAGNEGNKPWRYITAPADGYNTIAVGAVDAANQIANFSSVGPSYDGRIKPEIVAQGVSCYHADAYSEGYGYGGGTSFAAPIASGVVAQLLSAFPHLDNTQVCRIVIESGDDADNPDIIKYERGYGLLSAKRALEYPNLKEENTAYILNKMFIADEVTVDDSVFVAVYESSEDFILLFPMDRNDDYYTMELPSYTDGKELLLQFSIKKGDGIGTIFKDEIYKFVYGSLDIMRSTGKFIPKDFSLYQNYPNPFNGYTTIVIDVPKPSNLNLKIYDILGQKVKTIYSGEILQGQQSFVWDGINDYGSRVSTGVYFYRASINGASAVKKMLFLK